MLEYSEKIGYKDELLHRVGILGALALLSLCLLHLAAIRQLAGSPHLLLGT